MPERAGNRNADAQDAWERAWRARYEPAEPSRATAGARGSNAPRRGALRYLLIATGLLATTVAAAAAAESDDRKLRAADGRVTPARGEGSAVALGERNPGSGESTQETAIVANAGNGGLVLRPSNTAKGGRAVSATCDNDGQAAEDGCAVYVNKGTGAAASFRTQGSVPFAIRDTNNGVVQHLNSDLVDGKHATDFLGRSERAVDSALLGGNPASAFLGSTAKAADADAIDGQDSSAFLGASAKAADSNTLDGQDSTAFLGASAKAADVEKLDGEDSSSYARHAGHVTSGGAASTPSFTSSRTTTGVYLVSYSAGAFSVNGASCKGPVPIAVADDAAIIVSVSAATCSGMDGSGQFTVKTYNLAAAPTNSAFWFMVL